MPKKFLAPVVWTRPRCQIYTDNYRFGDSLIRGSLDNVERKYVESMARTEFKSLNRTPDPILSANLDISPSLTHSTSFAALPPRPESISLRRSKSVVRPVSAYVDMDLDTESTLLRRRSTRKRPETIHFPDITTVLSPDVQQLSNAVYLDRCRDLSTEVERLNSALLDTETKLKQEAANVKSKLNAEVQSLCFSAEEQERNLDVLKNLVQKQQRQIQDLQANYETMSRNYDMAINELSEIQRKALSICNEIDTMRTSLDRVS